MELHLSQWTKQPTRAEQLHRQEERWRSLLSPWETGIKYEMKVNLINLHPFPDCFQQKY